MPNLPHELPEGIQFGYQGATAGLNHDATRGVYAFDVPNGTVYLGEAVSASRSVALVAGAEAANVIPVVATVQAPGSTVTVAAVQRLLCELVDDSGATAAVAVFNASAGGTDVSTVGGARLIVDTAAAGTITLNVLDVGVETVHLLVRPLNAAGEQAHAALAFA